MRYAAPDPAGVAVRITRLPGLLAWLRSLAPSRPSVILTNGEDGPRAALRDGIQAEVGLAAEMPAYRQTIEI